MSEHLECADAIDFLRRQPAGSLDLIFSSPPYLDARTYGIDAVRQCEEWVSWMLDVSEAAVAACKGLVAWVVAGVQREGYYWPGPEGLVWEWYKRGHYQWCPSVWWKVDLDEGGTGIPGSGGKQGLRKDWEYILMFRASKELAYADNTACGHEPVYNRVGGQMSNRTVEGQRINAGQTNINKDPWDKHGRGNNLGGRTKDGRKNVGTNRRQNGEYKKVKTMDAPGGTNGDGTRKDNVGRPLPKVANPGNVLPLIVKARVGGGHMGNRLCHEGEAPFPEKLAEFFVLTYAAPGGLVCDPFVGSGTTASVCKRHNRNFTGCDLRQSQCDLTLRRLAGETPMLFS